MSSETTLTAAHVFISGSVQGVFFRDSTRRQALALGVSGWVRNLIDGRVEAMFEGPEDAVAQMLQFAKHGPPGAVVTQVETTHEGFTGKFDSFTIRPTC